MPVASTGLFEEFTRIRAQAGRAPSSAVTRVDQWYEGPYLLVDVRLGPHVRPHQVALIGDGARLTLLSRPGAAVLHTVSADRPVLWERLETRSRPDGLFVRAPVAGPHPVRPAPRRRPEEEDAHGQAGTGRGARAWSTRIRDWWSDTVRRIRRRAG